MSDERWRDSYDAWKLRAPEDEPGYYEEEPPMPMEETPTLPGLMMDWSRVADQLRKSANAKYEQAAKVEGRPLESGHRAEDRLLISADILSNIAYALEVGLGEK